ncbi:hypothetical protein [Pedobacter sp. BMA]|uniref:hypothetical protein n=1 Tax=Pedobacter sp. BMA TaxID=1663685 RepID=UPI00064A823E|nr:hypothetical protein [Pedobacter sp. BMA]KLT64750.1 hypothetical protein AB669_13480 [Pedobacter sp. BMA]
MSGLQKDEVEKKLVFYEVGKEYHKGIVSFLESYFKGDAAIKVEDLDAAFTGVQVASRDDFNKIINQGWTGDWDLNPANITTKRVQVASMNNAGLHPRGYYLNADIVKIEAIQNGSNTRYRLFIANPVIVNTGNRNVKFITQPVRYI